MVKTELEKAETRLEIAKDRYSDYLEKLRIGRFTLGTDSETYQCIKKEAHEVYLSYLRAKDNVEVLKRASSDEQS